jgi:hypothetical protein
MIFEDSIVVFEQLLSDHHYGGMLEDMQMFTSWLGIG